MKHESTINILRVPILSLKDFNQGTHMPEQVDPWTSPGWDKRYPMAWTSSMGGEVRFQKGWVDWLVRWIMIHWYTFFYWLNTQNDAIFWSRKYGTYILCSKDIYVEFRGFMFFSLPDMKLCQSELEDFLRCFANLLSNGWTSKLYSSSPWNSTERHGEQIAKEQNGVNMESSQNPESPLPTSWEQALGHSKRPSMNVGHPLAGWPAKRNNDPPLFEKKHHHIQQKTRWSDSIVIAHLWRGHFVHWCILQTKSWVNMSELNIYIISIFLQTENFPWNTTEKRSFVVVQVGAFDAYL